MYGVFRDSYSNGHFVSRALAYFVSSREPHPRSYPAWHRALYSYHRARGHGDAWTRYDTIADHLRTGCDGYGGRHSHGLSGTGRQSSGGHCPPPPPQATPAAAQPTSTPTSTPIPTSTVTGARPSTLEVRVTDDPPPKGVSRVEVTVGDVEVNMASADTEGGWSVVATGPKTFDLMQVMGVEELLGTADLIPGQYNQVRLEVKRSRLPLRGRIYRRGYPVASYGSWVDST